MALTFKPISDDFARMLGIRPEYSLAAETGELRFRLLSTDNTAYIRTEAASGGAWQSSHYHLRVFETYIVQHGWMCFVEKDASGNPDYKFYVAGPSFTTAPRVIHNVYLPQNAIIHTVKHGHGAGEGRFEDDETNAFDSIVTKLDETALIRIAGRAGITLPPVGALARMPYPPGDKASYSDAYKHFDNLIWQTPVWSAAIFTLALTAIPVFKEKEVLASLGLSAQPSQTVFFTIGWLFLFSLYYALYRFRRHQDMTKDYVPDRVVSPQFCLQLMVLVLSAIFGILALRSAMPTETWPFTLGIGFVAAITFAAERRLRSHRPSGGGGRPPSGGGGIVTRS